MNRGFEQWRKLGKVPNKRHKYGARKVEVNGEVLDSTLEARHYARLLMLQKAGEVVEIRRQVPFIIEAIPKELSLKYVADFVVTFKDGHTEVQDCKGFETREYKRKKRLLKKLLNIEIIEVRK